ncbi:hypothetical protein ACIREE_25910 [Streptomyces sp. NPDC102467]|uniref:hypothetical protein n=1 Tax=Streptomyces sp. NPDC102467 TaxID=3366179 RepID=UPI0038016EAD
MVSVSHAAHDIEVTAESLQEDLARLEVQKQALERELAAVVAHLRSVQRALGAFQALLPSIAPSTVSTAPPPVVSAAPREELPPEAPVVEPTTAPQAPAPAESLDEADTQTKYGKLTEQILDYFAEAGDVDVRARTVAAALGRDTDSGSINAVRSTLDRLVGTSRIRRAGRGLYRAA